MDLTITVPAIVAVIALIAGSIYIPIRLANRNAQAARRTQLEPAFDEILQAVSRTREVANTVRMGFTTSEFTDIWTNDVELLKASGRGRWPVLLPRTVLHQACDDLAFMADRLEYACRSQFTQERLEESLSRFVRDPDGKHSGLYQLVKNEIQDSSIRPYIGADVLQKADRLTVLLNDQLEYQIRNS